MKRSEWNVERRGVCKGRSLCLVEEQGVNDKTGVTTTGVDRVFREERVGGCEK